jgi:hypothetical protein
MANYSTFRSGGLCFGNDVLEFGQFAVLAGAAPENPRLAGIAFEPLKSLAARQISAPGCRKVIDKFRPSSRSSCLLLNFTRAA